MFLVSLYDKILCYTTLICIAIIILALIGIAIKEEIEFEGFEDGMRNIFQVVAYILVVGIFVTNIVFYTTRLEICAVIGAILVFINTVVISVYFYFDHKTR